MTSTLCLFLAVLAAQKDSTSGSGNALDAAARTGPYFDKVASKNVTALLGKTAYLNCRVKNLGNKTVSTFSEFICLDVKCLLLCDINVPITGRLALCDTNIVYNVLRTRGTVIHET